jgi:predicted nucleotidyltransferase
MTDLPVLLAALTNQSAEFLIVGGVAAVAHGSTRNTQDLDIVYGRDPANLTRIVAALVPFHPYLRGAPPGLPFVWDERTVRNGLNFTLVTDYGQIDLLGEITGGGGFHDLLPSTIELSIFGLRVHCLTLEKLIAVKRAAGRPKDFEAIAELEVILEASTEGDPHKT